MDRGLGRFRAIASAVGAYLMADIAMWPSGSRGVYPRR